jgi:hypothetical protein
MNIKGKVLEIFPVQQVKESFRKREFVVEYRDSGQYSEYIKFELIQDRCDLLNEFKAGDEIDVQFNLKGRIWTNPQGEKVYFNSLQAWRIDKVKEESAKENGPSRQSPPDINIDINAPDPSDDLPF